MTQIKQIKQIFLPQIADFRLLIFLTADGFF